MKEEVYNHIVVPDVYDEVYTTKKEFVLITGGRGSAKTFNLSLACTRLTYEANRVIIFSRYIMDSAEDSIIPAFLGKLELQGMMSHFKVKAKDVVNKQSGSKVLFRGIKTASGNQTAKLKGTEGLSDIIVDELEEWRVRADFEKLVDSSRQKGMINRKWLIMNPTDVDHFVYDMFIKDTHKIVMYDGVPVQISTHPDVCHIHTTWLDNVENLSEGWLAKTRREQAEYHASDDPNKILGYYACSKMGRWADRKTGVVFENWTLGEFPTNIDHVYGLDFGWSPDPLAMVKVAVDKRNKKIYVKQELYGTKISDDDILAYLVDNVSRRSLIVCDTNDGKTADRIRRERFNIHKAKKEKIKTDISDMADYELIIDPSSDKVIYELNNYTWNDKKASIANDNNNHSMDAIRYGFRRLMSPRLVSGYS